MATDPVRLTSLRPDGTASARLDDGTFLQVPGALPGDEVTWHPGRRRGRVQHAELDRVVTPSPDRIAPPCPHDAACGGCDLAPLRHPARGPLFGAMLASVFRQSDPVPVLTAPSPDGHRARISLRIQDGQLGYRGAGTHAFVPITTCRIARPEIQQVLPALQRVVATVSDPALDRVDVRSDGTGVAHVFHTTGPVRPGTFEQLAALGDVAHGRTVIAGDPTRWLPVGEHRLRASPEAFYQVHLEQNARLVDAVCRRILDVQPERVLDLYAGIGNFSIPLAASGVPVVAVEIGGAALKDLAASADRANVSGRVVTHATPAERYDVSREPFDAVVLDPPRAGAGIVLERVLALRPKRVVYVACQPTAAARDLHRHLGDYRLTEVFGVDLFPQTHHVEAVMVLDRPR